MENKQYQVFKEAIELGKQAYKEGAQLSDCPFEKHSDKANGWELGHEVETSLDVELSELCQLVRAGRQGK